MVAPLIAAAAISAAVAIYQGYQAEKARGANDKRLKELRHAFESIVPPDYDVSIDDPPKYIEGALQQADLDFSRLSPEAFKVVGQYSPQSAEFVKEQNPQLAEATAVGKEGRQAQLDALRKMQQVSRGDSPELNIELQRAADRSQTDAQSRSQSALQDAQRRGMSTSGLSFGAALQGSSDAMSQGAAQSQNAAIAAYRDRLSAIQNAGSMGRQLSQDDMSQQRGNADIVNAFNQRTSRAYQDYQNQRSALQNQAQLQNLGQEQEIANRNVQERNAAQQYNQKNRNQLAQQSYDNTRNERNYQNQQAYDRAAWSAQQKARQNDMKRQSYSDQLQRASGLNGLGVQEMAQRTQNTADRNAMIGGIGGAAAGYFGGQANADAQREAQNREDARWDKYYSNRQGG